MPERFMQSDFVDLKGRLSNPHKEVDALVSQGSVGATQPPRTPCQTSKPAPSHVRRPAPEEEGRLSNPVQRRQSRWRFGPSRNSIDVVYRSMSSQTGIASIEPRSSITSTPKGYRGGALSGNFVTTWSSEPLNSTKAGCRSQESLRHSVCMKQPSPVSSGQLECRFGPEWAGPHDFQRED